MPKPAPRPNARSSPEATTKLETSIRNKTAELIESVRLLNRTRTKGATETLAAEFEAACREEDAIASEKPNLLALSDELCLVHDLIEVACYAADSLQSGLGREPLSRLLNLISDKMEDARDNLEDIREEARA